MSHLPPLSQAKLGLISPASLQPGLVQPGGSVTPHLQRAFLRLAAVFSARQPWTRISERQTFRLRLPTPGGGGGSDVAWVSVIGEQSLRARAEVARLVAEGRVGVALPPVVRGLSVFFKRFDVERRCVVLQPALVCVATHLPPRGCQSHPAAAWRQRRGYPRQPFREEPLRPRVCGPRLRPAATGSPQLLLVQRGCGR